MPVLKNSENHPNNSMLEKLK